MQTPQSPQYSIWHGLRKALVQAVIFGLPIIAGATPEAWKNLTLGALLALVVNYVKIKWAEGTPNQ